MIFFFNTSLQVSANLVNENEIAFVEYVLRDYLRKAALLNKQYYSWKGVGMQE